MSRNLFRLLIAILVVAFIRYLISAILRVFSSSGQEPSVQAPPGGPPKTSASGGELHRDPVCGTFVSEATSLKSDVSGAIFYFCSANCRDRYLAASRERKA